jgi:hypothetical protein
MSAGCNRGWEERQRVHVLAFVLNDAVEALAKTVN